MSDAVTCETPHMAAVDGGCCTAKEYKSVLIYNVFGQGNVGALGKPLHSDHYRQVPQHVSNDGILFISAATSCSCTYTTYACMQEEYSIEIYRGYD